MDKFLFDFYSIINKMINYICSADEIKNNLNHCKYNLNENKKIKDITNKNIPIIFCLGGMAYKMYEKIINEQNIVIKLDSDTLDYDFSLSLKNNNKNIIKLFEDNLKKIFDQLIKNYSYTFDKDTIEKNNLKYGTINHNNFTFISERRIDRLHIKINCNIMKNLHILEFSFWYNNKISDNFTINDFYKNKILIYNSNKLNFYLLPLNLLVKTTLYAILDFIEKRNYNKCYKYIQRIKFIKKCHDEYINNNNNLILAYIFERYNHDIRKKYKIINDYPFLLAEEAQEIIYADRIYLTRCIHTDSRNNNIINIKHQFNNYKASCEKKNLNKDTINKYTEDD